MRRRYGREKVSLTLVLAAVAAHGDASSGELASLITRAVGCSERTVKDAFAVLRRGGYITAERDEDDQRRRRLRLTERGALLVLHPHGALILRHARRLFTTCPSRVVVNSRRASSEGERTEQLLRSESILLSLEHP